MKIKILALLVAFLLVAPALFIIGTSRAQNPIYFSVEPVATPLLTDTNSSFNGLETPPTPSPVGQNFTVEIHLRGATVDNIPAGIGGLEVHLDFHSILTYAVPTGFTDLIAQTGGVLNAPILEPPGFTGGIYDSNGVKLAPSNYTGYAAQYIVAAAGAGSAWNGADGLVANITFTIIKQPNASNGESTVSFPLALSFTDLTDALANEVTHDAIPGTLVIDSTGSPPPPSQYTLTVKVSGNGNVTWNPINAMYTNGAIVTLTATPDVNWTFQGWSGDLTGSQSPVNITMNGNKTVTATFVTFQPGQKFVLTVSVAGNGTVTENPNNATYASGTVVTLTVTPTVGWEFYLWSGDLTGAQNQINITMDANKNVTATFARNGDFNDDGKVSLADLVKLASWYNMNSADPLWNVATTPWGAPSMADLNHNGKIDLVDLLILAMYYISSPH